MAISVHTSMNGLAAIKKFGVPQHLFDWLEKSPVVVKLTASAFIFGYSINGENTTASVDVALNQLQKLNSGNLPAQEKAVISHQLVYVIGQLQEMHSHGGLGAPSGLLQQLPPLKIGEVSKGAPPVINPKVPSSPEASSGAKLPQAGPSSEINCNSMWATYDLSKIKTDPLTQLRDATKMYQPVKGTSGGSRYFLVAGNADMRIAARYKGGHLSVRIEGPKWEKHIASIKACGFDLRDQKKDYCSVHLAVPDQTLAQKTLGAVLLGLGVPLDTPIPNLAIIKG